MSVGACLECSHDHALADVVNAFLAMVGFENEHDAKKGAQLLVGLIHWMEHEGLTIAPAPHEQVN